MFKKKVDEATKEKREIQKAFQNLRRKNRVKVKSVKYC